jgi:hypothetical protein
MKQFTIYDETGSITGHAQVADDIDHATLDQVYPRRIPGYFDIDHFRIENSQAVPFTTDVMPQQVRRIRDMLLADIDNITAVWYASLSADQQQELQAYRVALLGVPQQAGFPTLIEWPTKPQWL